MNVTRVASVDTAGEVTCLSLFTLSGDTYIVAGSVIDGTPWIFNYTLDGQEARSHSMESHGGIVPILDSGVDHGS